jgi:hypothetical protein
MAPRQRRSRGNRTPNPWKRWSPPARRWAPGRCSSPSQMASSARPYGTTSTVTRPVTTPLARGAVACNTTGPR